ncbi:MAG TPA: FhaA domain-containing protein [Chloroflexia bacterium]|nr:FhaA domain-containing protein [Chloroflexia bacterium]
MKKALRVLEAAIEDLEGIVPRLWGRGGLQPSRLLSRVDREMEGNLQKIDGMLMAPNLYRVAVNPCAVQELEEMWPALVRDIDLFLAIQAEDQGYIFGWPRRYLVSVDEGVRPWSVRVESWCSHPDLLTEKSYDGQGNLWRPSQAATRMGTYPHLERREAHLPRWRDQLTAADTTANLRLMDGDQAGQQFVLGGAPVTVGRDGGCDLVVRDPRVSRQHAILLFNEGSYEIGEIEASNGTYVNAARIGPAPIRLESGALISLGGYEMIFEEPQW